MVREGCVVSRYLVREGCVVSRYFAARVDHIAFKKTPFWSFGKNSCSRFLSTMAHRRCSSSLLLLMVGRAARLRGASFCFCPLMTIVLST